MARDRLLSLAKGYLDQKHRTPEARLAGIREYSDQAYPDMVLVEPSTVWLTSLRNLPDYRDARVLMGLMAQAGRKEVEGDIDGAITIMSGAQRGRRYGNSMVVLNRLARLQGIKGNIAEADRLYDRAHTDPYQAVAAYVDHAWLLVDNRRYTKAKDVIDRGIERSRVLIQAQLDASPGATANVMAGARKPFLPSLVAMSYQQRKNEEGLTYLTQCASFEEEVLLDECVRAAMGLSLRDPNRELSPTEQMEIENRVATLKRNIGAAPPLNVIMGNVKALFD